MIVLPWREALPVARYELRRLLRARHGLARLAVLFLPVLITAIWCLVRLALGESAGEGALKLGRKTFTAEGDLTTLAQVFRGGYLRWIVFLSIVGLFGGLFSGERSEKTLHHLFLQPVSRATLSLGKYLGAVPLLWAAATAAWLTTMVLWMLPYGAGTVAESLLWGRGLLDLMGYVLILLLAVLTYGGLFLLTGAVFRSPPIVALGLLAWEGLCSFLPVSFQRFTIFYWLDSLLPVRVAPASPLAVLAEPAPWPVAVLACLGIAVACVLVAGRRAGRMELAYAASD